MSKIQRQTVKTDTEITGAGGVISDLINDNQVYLAANGLAKTLKSAIEDGDFSNGVGDSYTYYSENFDSLADFSTWLTGDSATPVTGGGTLTGTLALETSSPIAGSKSLKYTQDASSLNGWFATPIIPVDINHRGKENGVAFDLLNNANDDEIEFFVYDVTNAAFLEVAGKLLENVETTTKTKAVTFFIPTNCALVRVGFQIKTLNSGKILQVDNLRVTSSPFVTLALSELTDWESFTATGSWVTNTTYTGVKKRIGDEEHYRIRLALTGAPTATNLTITIPDSKIIDTNKIMANASINNTLGAVTLRDAGTAVKHGRVTYNNTTSVQISFMQDATANAYDSVTATAPFTFANGDFVFIEFSVPIVGWSSYTENIIVPAKVNVQSEDIALGGDFTGSIRLTKSGNVISISRITGITHASLNTATSAVGVLPEWARPTSNVNNIYAQDGARVYGVNISTAGTLQTQYRDWTGALSAATDASNLSTTYNVSSGNELTFLAAIPNKGKNAIRYERNAANQTIGTGGSPTRIDFANQIDDTKRDFTVTTGASWQAVCNFEGVVVAVANARWASASHTAGWRFVFSIYKNGVQQSNHDREIEATHTGFYGLQTFAIMNVNKGDIIDARIFQDSGITKDVLASPLTQISIARISL